MWSLHEQFVLRLSIAALDFCPFVYMKVTDLSIDEKAKFLKLLGGFLLKKWALSVICTMLHIFLFSLDTNYTLVGLYLELFSTVLAVMRASTEFTSRLCSAVFKSVLTRMASKTSPWAWFPKFSCQ